MTTIDPRASISADAHVADDARIGPWCELTGPVRIGRGARLIHRVRIAGRVDVGDSACVYPDARIIGGDDGAGDGAPSIVIEPNATVREHVLIDAGTADMPTVIGADAYLMVGVRVGASATIGDRCLIANAVTLGAGAAVGAGVIIGGSTIVGRGVRIGRLSMLSGVISVHRDVPPFCTAYRDESVGSLNLIGLRRAGLREHIDGLRRGFDLVHREGLDLPRAVERLRGELADNPLVVELADFLGGSGLGTVAYRGSSVD